MVPGIKKRPLKSAVFFVQDVLICHTLPRIITVCGIHGGIPHYSVLERIFYNVRSVRCELLNNTQSMLPVFGHLCFLPSLFFYNPKFCHLLSPLSMLLHHVGKQHEQICCWDTVNPAEHRQHHHNGGDDDKQTK